MRFNSFCTLLVTLMAILCGCRSENYDQLEETWFSTFEVDSEFDLQIVAAEPMLQAPVALDFDLRGRMWVVEMIGYMPNIDGSGEDEPNGTIVILEDKNGDGAMDERTVFLDQMVLPRAILHCYGGLLYSEPPNLWFVEINNDKPGKRTLVDSTYAEGGNVEHQANGLLLNLDNWIYSAKSNMRYRRKNGEWEKGFTAYRGQWGITNDHEGRLYYNDNSNQFKGDYLLPQTTLQNQYLKPRVSINAQVITDQRVYPLEATAVNRGYGKRTLHPNGKLVNFTSSCGPVVYRGGNWGDAYDQNSFVCGPEVNLIKHNILNFSGTKSVGIQARNMSEFIRSSDEGFRPVNIFNGPDGNLYVTDLHRGIIQHKSYMTEYLRKKSLDRKLDTIIDMGRILKISKKSAQPIGLVDLSNKSNANLIELLSHQNGWVRDRAQRLLIHQGIENSEFESLLALALTSENKNYSALHALWVLEGTNRLSETHLKNIIRNAHPAVTSHTLYILGIQYNATTDSEWPAIFEEQWHKKDEHIDPYLLFAISQLKNFDMEQDSGIYKSMYEKYKENPVMAEIALSGMAGNEDQLKTFLGKSKPITDSWLNVLSKVIQNRIDQTPNRDLTAPLIYTDNRTQAMLDYRMYCATCHGLDGEGRDKLAPPLNGSEYISGDVDQLILITLHGLQGPITVAGTEYNFNAAMPGLAANKDLSDETLSGIINFIRNGFATAPSDCSAERVLALRTEIPENGMWDVESLASRMEKLID